MSAQKPDSPVRVDLSKELDDLDAEFYLPEDDERKERDEG